MLRLKPIVIGISPVTWVRSLALTGSVVPDSVFSVFCSPNCSCISAILLQPPASGGRVALGLRPCLSQAQAEATEGNHTEKDRAKQARKVDGKHAHSSGAPWEK